MLLSKACVYGLRASLYLASNQNGEYVSIRDMSDQLDISFHFLTKVLQQLSSAGYMESYRGPSGGIRLTEKGKKAALLDVVTAIDGDDLFTECVLGLPGCGSRKPCPLHDQWAETRNAITNMLRETSLTDLAKEGKKMNLRITDEGGFEWR